MTAHLKTSSKNSNNSYYIANLTISIIGSDNQATFDGGQAGLSVASAGDFNGDGFNDLIIGAPFFSPGGRNQAGQVYIVYGSQTMSNQLILSDLDGSNGVIINGIAGGTVEGDNAGYSVSSAGDFNGDGFDDLAILSPNADAGRYPKVGQVYIIYGGFNITSPLELSNLDSKHGFVINGGYLVDGALSYGDFNGDNKTDLLIGAPISTPDSLKPDLIGGIIYLIYGASNIINPLQLSNLSSSNGLVINSTINPDNCNFAGASVASAGDFNNDGLNDILIGNPVVGDECGNGEVYVVFGQYNFTSPFQLSSLNGNNGIVINGVNGDAGSTGRSVSSAGDFNGDGIDDILIGAPGFGPGGLEEGQVYLVYGATNIVSPLQLSNLNGTNGLVIEGSTSFKCNNNLYCEAGTLVAPAGDLNGDNMADIIIGAPGITDGYFAPPCGGQLYVLFGSNNSVSPFSLSNLDNTQGVIINATVCGVGVSGGYISNFNGSNQSYIVSGVPYAVYNQFDQGAALLYEIVTQQVPIDTGSSSEYIAEIVGSVVGGVAFIGCGIGLYLYGRSHDWWGHSHGDYVTIND